MLTLAGFVAKFSEKTCRFPSDYILNDILHFGHAESCKLIQRFEHRISLADLCVIVSQA